MRLPTVRELTSGQYSPQDADNLVVAMSHTNKQFAALLAVSGNENPQIVSSYEMVYLAKKHIMSSLQKLHHKHSYPNEQQ